MTTTVFIDFRPNDWCLAVDTIKEWFTSRGYHNELDFVTYLASWGCVRIRDEKVATTFLLSCKKFPAVLVVHDTDSIHEISNEVKKAYNALV